MPFYTIPQSILSQWLLMFRLFLFAVPRLFPRLFAFFRIMSRRLSSRACWLLPTLLFCKCMLSCWVWARAMAMAWEEGSPCQNCCCLWGIEVEARASELALVVSVFIMLFDFSLYWERWFQRFIPAWVEGEFIWVRLVAMQELFRMEVSMGFCRLKIGC